MRRIGIILLAVFTTAGCGNEIVFQEEQNQLSPKVFRAGMESVETRTYFDQDLRLHWTEGDRLSIFKSTINGQYEFDGETGDNSGYFSPVGEEGSDGVELAANYAVYPYDEATEISSSGELSLSLPDVQEYAEGTFGLGANTMVAVTKDKADDFLLFKNVGGYIVLNIYGSGVVKSVTLSGNNGEKIAGKGTVRIAYGGEPSIVMDDSATEYITVDCGEGLELGSTPEDARAFWFVVPPVTFVNGYTIEVTGTDGLSIVKRSAKSRTVTRSVKNDVKAFKVDLGEALIPIPDANFKAYLVENFDTSGDGEISKNEALEIKTIHCENKEITNLDGIQYMRNASYLYCSGNDLTNLDLSGNESLRGVYCNDNKIRAIVLPDSRELRYLICGNNLLQSLDLANCVSLKELYCYGNDLTDLDLAPLEELVTLYCQKNSLRNLNVVSNRKLQSLWCQENNIETLTFGNNDKLGQFLCSYNRLNTIDVGSLPQLSIFSCANNNLSEVDVSDNTLLTNLDCNSNNLSILDLTSNPLIDKLSCFGNPLLAEIWLKTGHEITTLYINESITTVVYKD